MKTLSRIIRLEMIQFLCLLLYPRPELRAIDAGVTSNCRRRLLSENRWAQLLSDFEIDSPYSSVLEFDHHLPNEMQILVEIDTQKCIALTVKPTDRIKDVKAKIENITNFPLHSQTLFF
jgi:hypothetical protein